MYGPNSIIHVYGFRGFNVKDVDRDIFGRFMEFGTITYPLASFYARVDKYLDVPLFRGIVNGNWEEHGGDEILWLLKKRTWDVYRGPCADYHAEHGNLGILKWMRTYGGKWTNRSAYFAAVNGHVATVIWILNNGGESFTNHSACIYLSVAERWMGCNPQLINNVTANGHFEMFTWMVNNGGKHSCNTLNFYAASGGNIGIIKLLLIRGETLRVKIAAANAARNGHLAALKLIISRA
jgi:hypothetical protein